MLLDFDHKIEFSRGGATDAENGQALCVNCHRLKNNDWKSKAFQYITNSFSTHLLKQVRALYKDVNDVDVHIIQKHIF